MKVKNIYVTGRHKLRYTVYTGKGKRAGEYNQLQKSPRPLAVLAEGRGRSSLVARRA